MPKPKRRRANLGYSAGKHEGLVRSFASEANRQAQRAERMSSCRMALYHYGQAEKHLGAAAAHADSMEGRARQGEKGALVATYQKVRAARESIARRCNS